MGNVSANRAAWDRWEHIVIQYVPYVKHHDWNTLYTGGVNFGSSSDHMQWKWLHWQWFLEEFNALISCSETTNTRPTIAIDDVELCLKYNACSLILFKKCLTCISYSLLLIFAFFAFWQPRRHRFSLKWRVNKYVANLVCVCLLTGYVRSL